MIYITGDTHIPIDIHKLATENFPDQRRMDKDDFVVICGDFGGVWNGGNEEKYWIRWLNEKPFTTLFVDGNHENFQLLNDYPIELFKGGKVRRISDSVLHLLRGEVYTIEGEKFFTMGGASSHDKKYRKKGVSWWPEEMPSDMEYQNALDNLEKNGWNVDYIISHCCADSIQDILSYPYELYNYDELTNFFEDPIKEKCNYKKWFFGHYHEDVDVDDKHICLYERIIRLK